MSRGLRIVIGCVVFAALLVVSAQAGAKIEINEKATLDVGFRVQALYINTDKDVDGDGSYDDSQDFKIRRGRLRVGATLNELVSAFIQTEIGSGADGSGLDARIIDAFIKFKPHDLAQVVVGENMSPASRQNLTSSGALMTIDRPGINYKTLTWGARSVGVFGNGTYGDSDSGLRGDVDVRDTGVTLFGSTSLADELHMKYYLGVYDGIQTSASDNERYTGRIQVNVFEAESAYYNSSTYLGAKKTVGIGASYDLQSDVAMDEVKGMVDYAFYTADVFAELPIGSGSLTFEGAYQNLDLDGATAADVDDDIDTAGKDFRRSEGDGFYAQAGYYINQWQPWVEYETWDSEAADGKGSYDSYRVGVTYFIDGQNANVKLGYEHFEADANIGSSSEDTINTIVVGAYVTY